MRTSVLVNTSLTKAAYSRYCEGVRAEIALEYPSDPEVLLGSDYRVAHLSGISVGAVRLGTALMANFFGKESLQENMWPLNQKNRQKNIIMNNLGEINC